MRDVETLKWFLETLTKIDLLIQANEITSPQQLVQVLKLEAELEVGRAESSNYAQDMGESL